MTDFIQALEFGFGLMLVVVLVGLFIWGLTSLDKLKFLPKGQSVKMPKRVKQAFRFLVISQKTKEMILVVSVGVLVIAIGGGIFAAVLSAVFLSGSGTSHVAQPPPPNYGFDRYDEWSAAKHFIQAQYPGAQTFSGSDDSTVQASTDGTCIVAISVGGVNAFNAPL